MSRSTQFIGLNDNAEKYIEQNRTECETYETLDNVTGMFDEDVHTLRKYKNKNGQYFEEYVQAEPWSSGPCIFLALRWSHNQKPIQETLWSQNDINNC